MDFKLRMAFDFTIQFQLLLNLMFLEKYSKLLLFNEDIVLQRKKNKLEVAARDY